MDFIFDSGTIHYDKGEIIYSGNNFKRCLCFILRGKAVVYKTNAENRRIFMSRLNVSDCFGMATLFSDKDEFPTEIIADSACEILFIEREKMIRLFQELPSLAVNYAKFLTERIHFMNKELESLSCSDLNERLLSFLSGFPKNDEGEIYLDFSMSELSQRLNIGRASLYRIFTALGNDGRLVRNGKKIKITNIK